MYSGQCIFMNMTIVIISSSSLMAIWANRWLHSTMTTIATHSMMTFYRGHVTRFAVCGNGSH